MPAVDRAVLRLGVYELVERPDVPTAVILDEAVALAKRYSTDEAGTFRQRRARGRRGRELRPCSSLGAWGHDDFLACLAARFSLRDLPTFLVFLGAGTFGMP